MANSLLITESTVTDRYQYKTDPVLGSFLSFLANDIQVNPQRLKAATPELVSCIQNLVGGIVVDLDAPLDEEDD